MTETSERTGTSSQPVTIEDSGCDRGRIVTARRSPHTPITEHFWSQVERRSAEECWPWTRSRRNGMHGSFSIGDRKVYAHRFAYEQTYGSIPPGLVVRHSCDNGLCCNPRHLLIGTQQDNMRDMRERGRANLTGLLNVGSQPEATS